MRKMKNPAFLLVILLLGYATMLPAQESIYGLKTTKKNATSPTKDLSRPGSCWSHAGAALLEAEMLKSGKKEANLAEMDFVRNAYLYKADVMLNRDSTVRVDEKGIPYDVITYTETYGMAPEEAFMSSSSQPEDATSGEMDAILRGTLKMVQLKEGGKFTDRWKNTYDAALTRYIGDVKLKFNYKGEDYTPKSFAEKSGLKMSDYVMITSDNKKPMNTSIDLDVKNNWNHDKFYNVSLTDLTGALENAINNGYTVLWMGTLDNELIYADEKVAIVPMGSMPEAGKTEEPVPESNVSPTVRQEQFDAAYAGELSYLLVYGMSKDKKGNNFFKAKYVCQGGDQEINLSIPYFKLNTIYLMLNKNALSSGMRSQLNL